MLQNEKPTSSNKDGLSKDNLLPEAKDLSENQYNTQKLKKIPVYNNRGQVVGVIQNGILKKNANSKKHMLWNPHGWAFDAEILEKARRLSIRNIEIFDSETHITYHAKLSDYFLHGVKIERGYGKQICLPIQYFKNDASHTNNTNQLNLAIKE